MDEILKGIHLISNFSLEMVHVLFVNSDFRIDYRCSIEAVFHKMSDYSYHNKTSLRGEVVYNYMHVYAALGY